MHHRSVIYGSLCLWLAIFGQAMAAEQTGRQLEANVKRNVSEEMQLINKSLEDLLGELAQIKREATSRLSTVKRLSTGNDQVQERIRQTKVSKFVLNRVLELESESMSMRDELAKILGGAASTGASLQARQEDVDFDEPSTSQPATTEAATTTSKPLENDGMPATTTKPADEAAKLGFDMEALKKLGEEIGKRMDQFGKDAAKNLSDLFEGVKLVFQDPKSKTRPPAEGGQSAGNKPRLFNRVIVYDLAPIVSRPSPSN